jgi:hypothetical protein
VSLAIRHADLDLLALSSVSLPRPGGADPLPRRFGRLYPAECAATGPVHAIEAVDVEKPYVGISGGAQIAPATCGPQALGLAVGEAAGNGGDESASTRRTIAVPAGTVLGAGRVIGFGTPTTVDPAPSPRRSASAACWSCCSWSGIHAGARRRVSATTSAPRFGSSDGLFVPKPSCGVGCQRCGSHGGST